jgi:hypothetical protein
MDKKTIIYILLLISSFHALAQNKAQTICGEYIYYAPSNVSMDDALKTAIERAKIAALADKFGTLISQNNSTVVKNENGQSTTDFTSLGGSEVKGEWIEDTEIPQTKVSYEKEMLVVQANVCGKAREITRAAVDFSAKILRNGTDIKFESGSFKNGDDFYLYFKSPVNGFLAVYLIDSEQKAYCLLPYANNSTGNVAIEHGKEYIFFSSKLVSPEEARAIEEYKFTTEKSVEYNQIYIIFSPNEFTKANDSQAVKGLPRELTYSDFQHWIIKCRNRDNEIQVDEKMIEIRN